MKLFTFILTFFLVSIGFDAFCQAKNGVKVGVNPSKIDTSAMVEVQTTVKGFLPPTLTTAERDGIPSPAKGLVVFNLTTNALEVNTGTKTAPKWEPVICK